MPDSDDGADDEAAREEVELSRMRKAVVDLERDIFTGAAMAAMLVLSMISNNKRKNMMTSLGN